MRDRMRDRTATERVTDCDRTATLIADYSRWLCQRSYSLRVAPRGILVRSHLK